MLGFFKTLAVVPFHLVPSGNGKTVAMGRRAVCKILPQRLPMRFVNRVVSIDFVRRSLVAEFDVHWWHLIGHSWAFPGCHTVEALGQAAILLFSQLNPMLSDQRTPLACKVVCDPIVGDAKFARIVRAGDTLRLKVELEEVREPFVSFRGAAFVGDEPAVVVKRLMLRLVPKPEA